MTLIRNGRLVLEDQVLEGDLLIEGGRIREIAPGIPPAAGMELVDAGGCLVFPGFIDPHTHFQMSNALTTTADDYQSGSIAALHGGTTTVINFATSAPGMNLPEAIRLEALKAASGCACDWLLHAEMVDVNEATLQDVHSLKALGVRSLKAYMAYGFRLQDSDLYRTALACRDSGVLLEVHCENGSLLDARLEELVRVGNTAVRFKAKAHPAEAEAAAVYTLGQISLMLGCPVHVVHLSSRQGLEALRLARSQGAHVTAETCPQYLYLDESVYEREETEAVKYVCAPPPRGAKDQQAILEALRAGEIQTLATDHCAYRVQGQKDQSPGDFRRVPGGLPGVEERAQLCYTRLVASGLLDDCAFARLMATNSARLYGLYPRKGVLKVGADADLCLYDPRGETELTSTLLHSAAGYSPYEGIRVTGRVRDVFLRGQHVIQEGHLALRPKGMCLMQDDRTEGGGHVSG